MNSYPVLRVKQGREGSVRFKHPWIFSGALMSISEKPEHGGLVYVQDIHGNILGTGTYSDCTSIAVRIFDFKKTEIDTPWFEDRIRRAEEQRIFLGYGSGTETTAYRVIFAESDGIPGLVVDRYADVLVMQLSTAGIERLRPQILEALIKVFHPRTILERSDLAVRKEERLSETVTFHYGEEDSEVEFLENGLRFKADVLNGQKTGFFLDQKDLRKEILNLARDRHVLNLFSYSGASGIVAIQGGAAKVHNVDVSAKALEWCKGNAQLNNIELSKFTTENADVFEVFSSLKDGDYDMVLIDPPALIKSKRHIEQGMKAYHFLNRKSMKLVKKGGIFVTSSCSRFLSEEDFVFMLRQVSVQSGIALSVLKVVRQSSDHPLSIYFPESAYLKSIICQV